MSDEERAYLLKPEYERRPGSESLQHLPQMWPVVPSAGFWGGTSWLETHAGLVNLAEANKGPVDVLLVGDSITMQWGAAWTKHFPKLKTVNIGIGGDKTQNVLWRLEHGGVAGLEPRVIVLLIGNNNMFFVPETGIEAVAKGVKVCADNLRDRFPKADLIVVKIFPAHAPGVPFYEDIKKTNLAFDALKLESDPRIHVLDLWTDLTNADGTLRKGMFLPDNIHLTQDGGYELYASKLKPVIEALLGGKPVPVESAKQRETAEATPAITPTKKAAKENTHAMPAAGIAIKSMPVLKYPYAPYNDGIMDPQLTGWPLTDAELEWVMKEEYIRKPGHEAQRHLPDMWAVVPTAAHWAKPDGSAGNAWIEHHAQILEKTRACKDSISIALIGDSITQGWGGGWDGAPFNEAWRRQFAQQTTVNLGIGGDRAENILWRLDHGALDLVSPKVAVLLIGVNNAPLVSANGVPVESVAQGIKLCADNIRARCPNTELIVVKILPAFPPTTDSRHPINKINSALDALKLEDDPKTHVLDLSRDFANADGSLKTELYSDGHLHLGPAGYAVFASKLSLAIANLLK